ncbi:MAG: DUF3857 domain-containing transglutaminase family protein [Polyangiaceae bacterium]
MRKDVTWRAVERMYFMGNVRSISTAIAFALAVATSTGVAHSEIRRAPAPSWVTPIGVTAAPSPLQGNSASDLVSKDVDARVRWLVHDVQDRFVDQQQESFVHLAYVVRDPSDVQNGSELEATYDPSFERLTLHYVWVHRDGRRIDALREAEIREVSGENDREQFQYDEVKNVVIVLRDVRPLDVIEWAYSTRGQNPAVRGHVLSEPRLARDAAVQRLHVRLIAPTIKHPRHRTHGGAREPEISVVGELTEYRWDEKRVAAVEDEGDTPDWYVPEPWAEISDFATWSDVAAWALPLYIVTEPLPTELDRLVGRWAKLPSSTEKLFAAVRFVQEDLRYLGMEIGPHSLVPHSPNQTFERRFGDCKDKTLLLVTILRKLGISAFPALVSSRDGRTLPERLPSPYAFDHVITKVVLDGESYWFDPTIALERGNLRAHRYCDYEHALVIAEDTKALEPLARERPERPFSEVEEHYELGDLDTPGTLTVRTTLRGERADEFRARYQRLSRNQLRRDYLNFFAKRFEEVEALSDPVVTDDEGANVVRIEERYRLGSGLRGDAMVLSAWSFSELLEVPDVVLRKSPLKLRYPFVGEHRILLDYSTRPDFELPSISDEDAELRFEAYGHESPDRKHAEITYRVESLSDSVPPERVKAHLALTRRIDAKLDVALERPPVPQADDHLVADQLARHWLWVGAGLTILISFGIYRARTKQRRANSLEFDLGESASRPLAVPTVEAAKSHARDLRCDCRRVWTVELDRTDYVRFDGKRLFAVGLYCEGCEVRTSRYYVCEDSEPSESSESSASVPSPSSNGS